MIVARLAGIFLLGLAAAMTATAAGAESGDRHSWAFHLDLDSSAASSAADSWVDGGVGKLRYGEADDGTNLGRFFFVYDGRLTPTWDAHFVADYVDDSSPGVDVTEAYLQWHPLPRPAFRQRLKVGAFYPPFSLENGGPGWSNPYTISSSAINTWLGVEVRTLGAEWRLERPLGLRGSGRQLAFYASAFLGNDPAGTMLAWNGWAVHDRQTRLGDILPLPPLPQIQPGRMFAAQALQGEPFIETDDAPGFYVGAEWRQGHRVLLSLAHYDNHADPTSLRRGQYGWTTRFDHLGAQIELPGRVGFVAQWIEGTTAMGPVVGDAHVVDVGFDSYFALLTRDFGKHRLSFRYDDFELVDRDSTFEDRNDESGDALTLAYRYTHSQRLFAALEWLEIRADRAAWAYFGLPTSATERSIIAQIGLRLGPNR